MNDHPDHLLPAFVLDALNDEETQLVAEHLQLCAVCRAEVAAFRETLQLITANPAAHTPPPHIKQKLLARIAIYQINGVLFRPSRWLSHVALAFRRVRWMSVAMVLMLLLALVFGAMMVDAQRGRDRAIIALQRTEQQLDEQQQIIALVRDPTMASRRLLAHQKGAGGRILMSAGQQRMLLVVHGLPLPPAQYVYQFWFATSQQPIPSRTFIVDADGAAEFLISAPAPVNQYTQVMVTIEPNGGSATPSTQIVLSAAL